MSDRRAPSMEPAGRGRYQVMVRGASSPRATVSPEWGQAISRSETLPLPRVRSVTGRGLTFSSGADTFAGMRDARAAGVAAGLQRDSVPVSMTMRQARKAAGLGLLAGGRVNAGADRLALAPSMIFITVDFSDVWRLAKGFNGIAVGIRKGHGVIAKAINEGIRRFETGLKRDLIGWTGLKDRSRIGRGFRRSFASAETLTAHMRVSDRHIRITSDYFGAAWSRSNPGGTHAAWGRPQLARHSFMIPGAKPLFKRAGRARKPIEPLWGPNVVREIERHEAAVAARLAVVNMGVQQTAVRLMRMAIATRG